MKDDSIFFFATRFSLDTKDLELIKKLPSTIKKYIQDLTRIFQLEEDFIELYFCKIGFGNIYENHISEQKKSKITLKPNDNGYWKQIWDTQDSESKILKC